MERIEDGSTQNDAQRKPRWRTPELLQDKVIDATQMPDTIGAGDDHVVAYGVPLVLSS